MALQVARPDRPRTEHVPDDGLAPGPGRGRRRRKDKGLPAESERRGLAETYLKAQRRHWPDFAAAGLIPEPSPEALAAYAEDFRRRFLGEPAEPGPWDFVPAGIPTAVGYVRFSSDKSDPRSLDQQLGLLLRRAREEDLFVPWSRLFGDSAITATTAARPGWQLARAALRGPGPVALIADDIGRASRDETESHDLKAEAEDLGKRILGASDNVDTSDPEGDTVYSVHSLLNAKYVKALRAKVLRGQADAFGLGKNLGAPAFGYRLAPATGPDGRAVIDRKGKPVRRVEIHPEHAEIVREVFRRYAELGHSTNKLAAWLNATAAGGRRAWGTSAVAQMLDRYTYVGIEVRGMTRQKRDRKTGTVTHERRPRSDWQVRPARRLRIVDRATWKAVRKLRAERAGLFPEGSRGRAAAYPARLLALVCGGCGATLVLGKSGKYAQVRCPNAAEGKHGCTFRGLKSLRKVEGPVLAAVAERLGDPETVRRVVAEVGAAVEELSKLPRPDLAPLEGRVRELASAEARLLEAIETSDAAVGVLARKLEENQRRLAEARRAVADARAAAAGPPGPVTEEQVKAALSDLRGLLAEEPAAAAKALRGLIGKVVIAQRSEPGREKPVWCAEFRVDAVRAVVGLGPGAGSPGTGTLLAAVVEPELERVRLDRPAEPKAAKGKTQPPYVRHAAEAARLRAEGLTFKEMGERLGVHEVTARRACDHASPADRPPKGTKRPQEGRAAVARRRVRELLAAGRSVKEAAAEAGCSEMTAYRVRRGLKEQAGGSEAA